MPLVVSFAQVSRFIASHRAAEGLSHFFGVSQSSAPVQKEPLIRPFYFLLPGPRSPTKLPDPFVLDRVLSLKEVEESDFTLDDDSVVLVPVGAAGLTTCEREEPWLLDC